MAEEHNQIKKDIAKIEDAVHEWELSQTRLDEWRTTTVRELQRLNTCFATMSQQVSEINTKLAVLGKLEDTCITRKGEIDVATKVAHEARNQAVRNKDALTRAWVWLTMVSAALLGVAGYVGKR